MEATINWNIGKKQKKNILVSLPLTGHTRQIFPHFDFPLLPESSLYSRPGTAPSIRDQNL